MAGAVERLGTLARLEPVIAAVAAYALFRETLAAHPLVNGNLPMFMPHRPDRPEKSEGGIRFDIVSVPRATDLRAVARATELMGVPRLGDLETQDLWRLATLPEPLDRRVRHVITENARVRAAVASLRERDLPRLGKLLAAEGGVGRACVEVLARNETIYFMPDQDPPKGRGVYAPFFGVAAHTPTLVAKLVKLSGAPVVFFYGERLPWGRGFIAHWFAAPPEIYSEDLETSVAGMNAGLERCARDCPEQYWWGYKRFRRRPVGQPRIY